MKKKQKYCIIAVCILLFITSIFLIFKFNEKDLLPAFYPTSETALYDLEQEDLTEIGIEAEWVKSYHALSSLLAISCERIFMFEVETNRMDLVKETCHAYIKKLKKEFANSSQEGILKDYEEYVDEDYYILVISKKANTIMNSIKERIQ